MNPQRKAAVRVEKRTDYILPSRKEWIPDQILTASLDLNINSDISKAARASFSNVTAASSLKKLEENMLKYVSNATNGITGINNDAIRDQKKLESVMQEVKKKYPNTSKIVALTPDSINQQDFPPEMIFKLGKEDIGIATFTMPAILVENQGKMVLISPAFAIMKEA